MDRGQCMTYGLRTFVIVLALLTVGSLAALAQDVKCTEVNGLKNSEIKDLIKSHNSARDTANVADLTWDCTLAAKAQAAADASAAGSTSAPAPGENRTSSYDSGLDIKTVLGLWREERRNWDSKSSTCETGRICNNWAQMVNTATTRFGCGINRKGTGNTKAFFVCTYDAPR